MWTYTEWGGAQLYMLTIMRMAQEKWDVVAAIPHNSKPEMLEFYEPHGISIDFLDSHFDAKPEPTFAGKVRRQFERIRAEFGVYKYLRRQDLKESIVHMEVGPWQSWLLLALLSLRGANVFTTLNLFRPEISPLRAFIWKLRFQTLCRFRGIHIAASNLDAKQSLKAWVPRRYWSSIPIGYSPIDVDQISEALRTDITRLRESFGLTDEDFVILAVGRFVDLKGRWIFLDTAKRVLSALPKARFVWLSQDPLSEEDHEKIASYNLKDRFVHIRSRDVGSDRRSLLSFFRIADVFTLPSFREGLPLSLIEAMALGVPSVGTNIFAVPEAILPGETGLLVDAGDSSGLAAAILKLAKDSELRKSLSDEGSKFVIDHFDGRIMAKTYLDEYEKCFRNEAP